MGIRAWVIVLCAVLLGPATAHAQATEPETFLLVASPDLRDPNFARTVILALRVDEGGPLGVILNRPTEIALQSLFPDRDELKKRQDAVFFGGPVQPDALLFAFRSATPPPKGTKVADDIYISGFSGVLEELLRHPEHAAEQRFFAGYAGWAEGQLEAEIEAGGWYVLPTDPTLLFLRDTRGLYEELLARATAPRIEASFSRAIASTR